MNASQQIWWEQTRSDHAILILLRGNAAEPCHQLHYLQMVTEKLGKAYFWRNGKAPKKSHVSFVSFLKALGNRSQSDQERIARALGFPGIRSFTEWTRLISPLAHAIEKLAPSLAGDDGPNPEYPWPRLAPVHAPTSYSFDVWREVDYKKGTGRGRQFLDVIASAVREFPSYC